VDRCSPAITSRPPLKTREGVGANAYHTNERLRRRGATRDLKDRTGCHGRSDALSLLLAVVIRIICPSRNLASLASKWGDRTFPDFMHRARIPALLELPRGISTGSSAGSPRYSP
jgi:hypothetical protein